VLFQVRLNAAGAPVRVAPHVTGLPANHPVILPLLIVSPLLVAAQLDSFPLTGAKPVPPPAVVSGDENVTLARYEHVTLPGAGPEKPDDRATAYAGDCVAMTGATANPIKRIARPTDGTARALRRLCIVVSS